MLSARHFPESQQEIRSFTAEGAPWFIAKDVCDILGLSNPRQALASLDADEKGVTTVDTPGGRQEVLTVNESGLYALVMRSRKPQAKAFRKWVTGVVLPAIRRDGGYIRGEELMNVAHLGLPQLAAREAFLKEATEATLAAKLKRERRKEEKEGRANAFKALRRR